MESSLPAGFRPKKISLNVGVLINQMLGLSRGFQILIASDWDVAPYTREYSTPYEPLRTVSIRGDIPILGSGPATGWPPLPECRKTRDTRTVENGVWGGEGEGGLVLGVIGV